MSTLNCLVMELWFLVGLSWHLFLAIGSSEVVVKLFGFQVCLCPMQISLLVGRIDWAGIRIDSIGVLATFS